MRNFLKMDHEIPLLVTNAIPIFELQVALVKLVNNMSSGAPVPSLGHLFPKLE